MSRLRDGIPFTGARVAVVACGLLAGASSALADGHPEARFCGTGKADPIRITNVRRSDGPAAGQSRVTFDLAWDQSWRAAWDVPAEQHGGTGTLKLESWDAAWVFAKFRKPGDDGWSHATLSTSAADHSVPAGAALDVGPSDDGTRGLGAFVSRAGAGSGANDFQGVTLWWLHKADGVDAPGAVELKVFAIQIVYVPEGPYYLGSGCLILPEQYAGFMHTLNPTQAEARDAEGAVTRAGQAPDYTYTGVDSGLRLGPGCRGLSWADGAAFAAWAGLRPMTELECEKIVRGFREPIPNEVGPSYWGIEGYGTWDWDAFKGHNHIVERPVTVGNAAGRRFQGTHGPGTPNLPADWPQEDAVGAEMRCSWCHPSPGRHYDLQRTRLSDRLLAALVDPERHPEHRWRGVRTAPNGVGPSLRTEGGAAIPQRGCLAGGLLPAQRAGRPAQRTMNRGRTTSFHLLSVGPFKEGRGVGHVD